MTAGLTGAALVAQVAASVEHMEHEVTAIVEAVAKIARGEPLEDVPESREYRDTLWLCPACQRRMGVYDRAADVMRIKYRDLYVQVHCGPGGWVEVPCTSCGFVNRAADTTV